MNIPADQFRPLGTTGVRLPPVIFGSSPLANIPQVIPEQRKLAICNEWLRRVGPPAHVSVVYSDDDGQSLAMLARILRSLEVRSEEIVIHLAVRADHFDLEWEESCRLLGKLYQPKLLSVQLSTGSNTSQCKLVTRWKSTGNILGVGAIIDHADGLKSVAAETDWIVLTHGFSLLRHTTEILSDLTALTAQRIPVITAGVFERGFLLGGNRLDGQVMDSNDPTNRSLLAWRTSFAALCHGYGVSPTHACIQFALSAPAVIAAQLTTSHPDRVAENIDYCARPVPRALWISMKEEGLLAADYPWLLQ